MLHLVFQSSFEIAILDRINSGDLIVFMGDSVLRALDYSIYAESFKSSLANRYELYVLEDDIVIRGIAADRLVRGIQVIDYSGLVALTTENKVIQSWF